MSYFTSAQHSAVAADPTAIASLYTAERTRFLADLGGNFSAEPEEHFKLAFCGVFAYDHAPYGSGGGSVTEPLTNLLAAASMDCDNYVAVTWRLFNLLVPAPETRVTALGWDGGYFGNHAQLAAHKSPINGAGGGSLLVDPTIGLVLCAHNFDWYAASKQCSSAYSKSFYYDKGDGIGQFNTSVQTAIFGGLLKPSNILYAFDDIEQFVAPPPMSSWPTPALASLSI